MAIQEFDLDIQHRAGKNSRVADALSRNPVDIVYTSVVVPVYEVLRYRASKESQLQSQLNNHPSLAFVSGE